MTWHYLQVPKPKFKPPPPQPKLPDIFEVTADRLGDVMTQFEGAITASNKDWVSPGDGDMVLQVLRVDSSKEGRKLALSDGTSWHYFKPVIDTSSPFTEKDIEEFSLVNVAGLCFTGSTTRSLNPKP